jgi:predicted negative regulator of RcsB-dependent stress response
MMKKRAQNGIAHLGLLLLLLVIVVIAFVGYKVWNNRSTTDSSAGTASTQQPGQAINTEADLNQAESNLNSQNIDNALNPDAFDQDTQSLL